MRVYNRCCEKNIMEGGGGSDAGNYRLVNLTSVVCKVKESIVRDKMIQNFSENQLLSDCQHGFIGGRLCTAKLNEVLDMCADTLENKRAQLEIS